MSAPTLAISLTTSSDCTGMSLKDTTADYGGGTVTVNSVTSVIVTVNIAGGSYFTYTFTVSSGTITAATLSLSGATPTNILASLVSTVWPFVTTQLPLWGSYGVTLPDFADGVVEVNYEIIGSGFDYTTSAAQLIPCVTCCCVTKMGQKLDPSCDCKDCIWDYLLADTYLQIAKFATQVGNTDRAQLALDKAAALCDCNCSDC